MKIDFELDVASFERELARQRDIALRQVGMALHALAETTMTLAKADYVPVKTGYLRSTGWVEPSHVVLGNQITVMLGFATHYAERVHEGPWSVVGRNQNRPLAGRKYLERPMLEVMATAEERIARFLQGGAGRTTA